MGAISVPAVAEQGSSGQLTEGCVAAAQQQQTDRTVAHTVALRPPHLRRSGTSGLSGAAATPSSGICVPPIVNAMDHFFGGRNGSGVRAAGVAGGRARRPPPACQRHLSRAVGRVPREPGEASWVHARRSGEAATCGAAISEPLPACLLGASTPSMMAPLAPPSSNTRLHGGERVCVWGGGGMAPGALATHVHRRYPPTGCAGRHGECAAARQPATGQLGAAAQWCRACCRPAAAATWYKWRGAEAGAAWSGTAGRGRTAALHGCGAHLPSAWPCAAAPTSVRARNTERRKAASMASPPGPSRTPAGTPGRDPYGNLKQTNARGGYRRARGRGKAGVRVQSCARGQRRRPMAGGVRRAACVTGHVLSRASGQQQVGGLEYSKASFGLKTQAACGTA